MKELFFDFGGLLFDITFNQQTSDRAHSIAQDYLKNHGINVTDVELREHWGSAIQKYIADRKCSVEWPMERIVGEAYGLDEHITQALVEIYTLNDHDFKPYEQTEPVLKQLAEKHPLHIISDCPHDSIRHKLETYNMQDLFRTITMSYEVGFRKPRPAIYREAMRRAGTTPENSVYISHDFERDLSGAALVGMDTRLIQPEELEDLLE